MTNNLDLVETTEMSKNAKGGTELMMSRLFDGKVPRELLEQFQIIPTRVRDLKLDKFRILYVHDLAEDPEVQHLANDGWRKFHRIVFVSNWQMQRFIERFSIPWSKCAVIQNAIDPIEKLHSVTNTGIINLVYHTTPHRGLQILLPVFDKLSKEHENIHLNLLSSYKLYGWEQRDEQYKELFEFADKHEKITNFGTKDQEETRSILASSDIFAYPSIWQETSCLCLMEAMSAGLVCVHPNYGALFETAANWTYMYQLHEDMNEHAKIFYQVLDNVIRSVNDESIKIRTQVQKNYADTVYNWSSRAKVWEAFLNNIVQLGEPKEVPNEQFVYKFG